MRFRTVQAHMRRDGRAVSRSPWDEMRAVAHEEDAGGRVCSDRAMGFPASNDERPGNRGFPSTRIPRRDATR